MAHVLPPFLVAINILQKYMLKFILCIVLLWCSGSDAPTGVEYFPMTTADLQQLTAMDYMFLTQEAVDTPMHIGLLMFYTPATSHAAPVRFKEILTTFKERAACAPIFHRRELTSAADPLL